MACTLLIRGLPSGPPAPVQQPSPVRFGVEFASGTQDCLYAPGQSFVPVIRHRSGEADCSLDLTSPDGSGSIISCPTITHEDLDGESTSFTHKELAPGAPVPQHQVLSLFKREIGNEDVSEWFAEPPQKKQFSSGKTMTKGKHKKGKKKPKTRWEYKTVLCSNSETS